MLEPGTSIPEFTVEDHHRNTVASADWRDHWTVVWWYVKADTPG